MTTPSTPRNGDVRKYVLAVVLTLLLGACQVPAAGPRDLVVPTVLGRPDGAAYGTHPRHRLDVHRPPGPARGILVFAHGGAWLTGDKSSVHPAVAQQVANGWVVISVNYRFADETRLPAAVTDLRRAVAWARSNTAWLGVGASAPVVVSGYSAGGHLALMSAYGDASFGPPGVRADLQRVDAVISLAGPTELMGWSTVPFDLFGANAADILNAAFGCPAPKQRGTLTCPMSRLAVASPLWSTSQSTPPTYLAYGTRDNIVPAWQGTGLHDRIVSQAGNDRVWLDVSDSSHDLERLNATYLTMFLDRVVEGTLRR